MINDQPVDVVVNRAADSYECYQCYIFFSYLHSEILSKLITEGLKTRVIDKK